MKILSLSGGMDSTTLLSYLLSEYSKEEIIPVSFSYGSKHNPYENECAYKICNHYGLYLIEWDISAIMRSFSSNLLQTGGEIPEGHYEAENMKLTVVPGRNLIFLSILAGICESRGGGEVYLGIHRGDRAIYPDCRSEFLESVRKTVELSSDGKVTVEAPFIEWNKTSILSLGKDLKTPYELTRTCYKNQGISCGKCGFCQERLEAFVNNGMVDPLKYES